MNGSRESSAPLFSIVVPVYFNELNLPDTVPALLALEPRLGGGRLELVFVDDGSRDGSLSLLRGFQEQNPEKIRIVKLTRNFGAMAASQAGFMYARGDCVGIIAADLQDPPELFVEMFAHWRNGAKAVFAVRSDREESVATKLPAAFYYLLLRRFAIRDYPRGGFDFCLVDRQVVATVNEVREKNTNLNALIFWLGFSAVMIPYVRRRRTRGRSRWTLGKKVKLVIDSFVSFSYAPVRLLSAIGLITAFLATCYAAYVVYSRLVHNIPVPGFSTIVILTSLFSGLQMTMLGVLGEYLWRTLDETRRRPNYVVDEVFDRRP